MTNIPIKASVVCSDGPCGQSTNVIVNPVNHKVTHFALRDKSLPNNTTRLVPAGMVADVTPQQITLTCSKADVAEMPPFIVTNFIAQSAPGYAYATGEAYHSQYVINDTGYDAVKEQAIPAGCQNFEFDPQAIGKGLGQIIFESHGFAAVVVVAVGIVVGDDHQLTGPANAFRGAVPPAAGHEQHQRKNPQRQPSKRP